MNKKLKQVEGWNKNYPVGTEVIVRRDNGTDFLTSTRSPAELLQGQTPVIWVKGISGCYALSHVRPFVKDEKN